ncbi:MAG: hypothetical protein ACX93N_03330 [Pseudohaliea sp.]
MMIMEDHAMKKRTNPLYSLLVAGSLGVMATTAAAGPAKAADPLQASFAGLAPGAVKALTATELDATKGQWLPAFVFGVVGADLALSAYFWGVYVPNYAAASGGCPSCAASSTNLQ